MRTNTLFLFQDKICTSRECDDDVCMNTEPRLSESHSYGKTGKLALKGV